MSKEKLGKTPVDIQKKNDDWDNVHNQLQQVQKKSMSISSPEDEDEKEADTIARRVVSGDEQTSVRSESGGEMIHRSHEMAAGIIEHIVLFEEDETEMSGVRDGAVFDRIKDSGTITSMNGGSKKYSESVRQQLALQYKPGTPEGIKANNDAGKAACDEARARLLTVYDELIGGTPPEAETYKPTDADTKQAEWGEAGTGLKTPFIEGRNVVLVYTFRI
jgi:hypothetical protein